MFRIVIDYADLCLTMIRDWYKLLESSNVEEKRKIIGMLFSNLQLEGATLRYTLRSPFDTFANAEGYQEWCAIADVIRTDFRQDVLDLYSLFQSEMKEWLEKEVSKYEVQGKNIVHKYRAA